MKCGLLEWKRKLWDTAAARHISTMMTWLMLIRDCILNQFYRTSLPHFIYGRASCFQQLKANMTIVSNSKSTIPNIKLGKHLTLFCYVKRSSHQIELQLFYISLWGDEDILSIYGKAELYFYLISVALVTKKCKCKCTMRPWPVWISLQYIFLWVVWQGCLFQLDLRTLSSHLCLIWKTPRLDGE